MKESFNSAVKDPFIKDLIKVAAIVAAAVLAVIGIKTMSNYIKKKK